MRPSLSILHVLLALCAALPVALQAQPASTGSGQPYPARPIRLVVPFPPGGTIDIIGRMVAQDLGERVGQTVVVDNRSGAGGMLGVDLVVKAAADGYTLCLCSAGAMINSPLLSGKPPYDARHDLAPVSAVASAPYLLLVRPASGLNSIQDFARTGAAKARHAQLWLGGHRQHLASGSRAVCIDGRRQCGARAIQR